MLNKYLCVYEPVQGLQQLEFGVYTQINQVVWTSGPFQPNQRFRV